MRLLGGKEIRRDLGQTSMVSEFERKGDTTIEIAS